MFFIVWGFRGRNKTIDQGQFFCPDCGDHRVYRHEQVNRYFTLYWIPLFSTGELGKYIECNTCKSTFNERVLEFDPAAAAEKFEAAFSIAAKRVMFKMALADGEIDDGEIAEITQSFSNIAKREIDQDDIAAELEAARDDSRTIKDYLTEVAPSLNDSGKEIVYRAAIAVAKADGRIDPEEVKLLEELGTALDMPKAYAKGVLAEEGVAA